MRWKFITVPTIVIVVLILFSGNSVAYDVNITGFWQLAAGLSTNNSIPSINPEIDGYKQKISVVWQEWNGADYDVYMKANWWDGSTTWHEPGTNSPPREPPNPAVHPATIGGVNEINPDVATSRDFLDSPHSSWVPEQHIVYEDDSGSGIQTIWHTYTKNMGWETTWPKTQISTTGIDAQFPSIVYSEDVNNPGGSGSLGFAMHMVWMENNNGWKIMYQAYYYNPSMTPQRGYYPSSPIVIGFGTNPKIAAVDDTKNSATYDFSFGVVWEQPGLYSSKILYRDGTLKTSPSGSSITLNFWGIISPAPSSMLCHNPDIAATQNTYFYHENQPTLETYYYHIVWEQTAPSSLTSIESSYYHGPNPTPSAAGFTMPSVPVEPPVLTTTSTPHPTIGVKLRYLNPHYFIAWISWEKTIIIDNPVFTPDIYYRTVELSQNTSTLTWFTSDKIGYLRSNQHGPEHNPEIWCRNDLSRDFPPRTHWVWDDWGPTPTREIEYIDP